MALTRTEQPSVDVKFDYSGDRQQHGSADTLAVTGRIHFVVNKVQTAAEFDDLVSATKIIVKHGNTVKSQKTLKECLNFTQTLDAVRTATASGHQVATDIDVSTLGAENGDQVTITGKVSAGPLAESFIITIADGSATQPPPGTRTMTFDSALRTYLDGPGGNFDVDGVPLSTIIANTSRYDKTGDKAYIVVDENGELIDNCPVNIDQDDIVYLIVVGRKDKIDAYSADFIGTYSPTDLQMRSFTPIDPNYKPNGLVAYAANEYTVIVKKRGPFTSANLVVKVKDNAKSGAVLATYTLTINTLFHLGFGVGFNRTALENPEYVITPLNGTQNTITRINGGRRNLVSVNVIWYWTSTLKYLSRGDNVTRGRDVLKEPDFIERINPTFGVSLTGNLTDNLFTGLTFEFARGGSLFAGYHFGVVRRLSYPDGSFVTGTDVFTGAAGDIKTSNVSRRAWAFGLILDTRILNALFKKGS